MADTVASEIKTTQGHKDLAAFIKTNHSVNVKPESVALVLTAARDYRNSPERRAELDARKAGLADKKRERVQKAKEAYEKAIRAAEAAGVLEEAEETDDFEEETTPEPAPKAKAPAKKTAESDPANIVQIEEIEASDGWEQIDSDEDDDEEGEDF